MPICAEALFNNVTPSRKWHQWHKYMPKRIRKIVAWLGVKEFNDMSLGRLTWFCKQVLSIFPSCSRPAKFIENAIHYMKCASPHLSWLFWKTTWASSANLGRQKHGLLKGAVSISMVQMKTVSISWKLNCWVLPFLWLNHCLDSGSMASLYLKVQHDMSQNGRGPAYTWKPTNPKTIQQFPSEWLSIGLSHPTLKSWKTSSVCPIFSQGIRTPVPIGASGRVEQDILPETTLSNKIGDAPWTKNTQNHV